jgi:acyl-CoA dehydrogenase
MADLLIEEELQILKKTVHTFVKEHVEAAEQSPGSYIKELPIEVVNGLQEKAKRIGFTGIGCKKGMGRI